MNLSLLFLDSSERRTQPKSLARDLNLDRLLGESTLGLLLTICTPEERKARLGIFRLLGNDEFAESFRRLDETLTALSQTSAACKSAKCEFESLIFARNLCVSCTAALDELDRLCVYGLDNALTLCIRRFSESVSERREILREAVSSTEPDVSAFSELSLTYLPGKLTLTKRRDESISDRLQELIRGMGLSPTVRSCSIRVPPELSDSFSRLFPESFARLKSLCGLADSLAEALLKLRREVGFYLELTGLAKRAKAAGMSVCSPVYSDYPVFRARNAYDFTLLVKDAKVIPNDIDFDGSSAVSFLTGANGGGKTTYLRCTAANLLLALAGCPVFAASAEVGSFDTIRAHFPADESFSSEGRLFEEARRVDSILSACGRGSFVFMNETYSGADDIKGANLTVETARKLRDRGVFALWVTHFHEAAAETAGEPGFAPLTTVVDESDTSNRTFRIVKKRGGGSSFAEDILKKYSLDAGSLERALRENLPSGERSTGKDESAI